VWSELLAPLGAVALSAGTGLLSALVPLVNAEVYALAVGATASPLVAALCAVALAVGQTGGKWIWYTSGRKGVEMRAHSRKGRGRRRRLGTGRGSVRGGAAPDKQAPDRQAPDGQVQDDQAPHGRAPDSRAREGRVQDDQAPHDDERNDEDRDDDAREGEERAGRLAVLTSRLHDRRSSAGIVLLSGSVGLPPLALVAVAAGATKMRLRDFLLCCLAGRTVRFGLVLIPLALR